MAPPMHSTSAMCRRAFEHADLVADLRATDDGYKGALWILDDRGQHPHLSLHQASRAARQAVCDPFCACVRPVCATERVVDVYLSELGECGYERAGSLCALCRRLVANVLPV